MPVDKKEEPNDNILLTPFREPTHQAPHDAWISPKDLEKAQNIYYRVQAVREVFGGKSPVEVAARIPEYNEALHGGSLPMGKMGQVANLLSEIHTGGNRHQLESQIRNVGVMKQDDMNIWNMAHHDVAQQQRETRAQRMAAVAAAQPQIAEWYAQTASNASLKAGKEITEQEIRKFVPHLSDQQLAAIQSPAQVTNTFAGPGAGKSTMMIAQLIDDVVNRGTDPSDVIITSKTHSAVNNILQALQGIETILPGWDEQQRASQAKTLDSLGFRLLMERDPETRKNALQRMNLPLSPLYKSSQTQTIASELAAQRSSTHDLVRQVMDHYGISQRINNTQDIDTYIAQAKNDRSNADAQYTDRYEHGREIFASQEWQGEQQLVDPNLMLYLYQNALYGTKHFKQVRGGKHSFDINDVPYLVQKGVREGHIAPLPRILGDEIQDANKEHIRMLGALTGPTSRAFFGGDMGQPVMSQESNIDELLSQVFAGRSSKHTLPDNNRSGIHTVSFLNRLNQSQVLENHPKSVLQVAMGPQDKFPTTRVSADFPTLYRSMISDWMEEMGLSFKNIRRDIHAQEDPFQNAARLPSQAPFIFQMDRSGKGRNLFETMLKQVLAEHMPDEDVNTFMQNHYSRETPSVDNKRKMQALLISQARSRSAEHVYLDVTRQGLWDAVGYAHNLFTGASRSTVQNHFYASKTNVVGNQYNLTPDHLHGVELPPGFKSLYQGMIEDAVAYQGMDPSELPAQFQNTRQSASITQQMQPEDSALFQRFIEDVLLLNKHYQSPVGGDTGISGLITEQKLDRSSSTANQFGEEANWDGMRANKLNAAIVTGQYGRSGDPIWLEQLGRMSDILITQGNAPIPGSSRPSIHQDTVVPTPMQFLEQSKAMAGRVKHRDEDWDFPQGPGGEKIVTPFDPKSMLPAETEVHEWDIERDPTVEKFAPRDSHWYRGRDEAQLRQSMRYFAAKPEARTHPFVAQALTDQYSNPRLISNLQKIAQKVGPKDEQIAHIGELLNITQTSKAEQTALHEEIGKIQNLGVLSVQEHKQLSQKRQLHNLMSQFMGPLGAKQIVSSVQDPKHSLGLYQKWLSGVIHEKVIDLFSQQSLSPDLMQHLAQAATEVAGTTPGNKEYFQNMARTFSAYHFNIKHEEGLQVSEQEIESIKQERPFEGAFLEQIIKHPVSGEILPMEDSTVQKRIYSLIHTQGALMRTVQNTDQAHELGLPYHMSNLAPALTAIRAYASSLEGHVGGRKGGIIDPMAVIALPHVQRIHDQRDKNGKLQQRMQDSDFTFQQYGAGVSLGNYEKRLQALLAPRTGALTKEQSEGWQAQLTQVQGIRTQIHNPQQQLRYAQLMRVLLRATTGENVKNMEKTVEGEEPKTDPITSFMRNRSSDYVEGTRTIDSLEQFLHVLNNASEHMEKTGTLKRSHITSLLETFGHNPQDAKFIGLRGLEKRHNFLPTVNTPDPSISLENIVSEFPDERQNLMGQLTRVPLVQGQTYTYKGGTPGYGEAGKSQAAEFGMHEGMQGQLEFGDDFGLSKKLSYHRNRVLLGSAAYKQTAHLPGDYPYQPVMYMNIAGKRHPITPEQLAFTPQAGEQLPWQNVAQPDVRGPEIDNPVTWVPGFEKKNARERERARLGVSLAPKRSFFEELSHHEQKEQQEIAKKAFAYYPGGRYSAQQVVEARGNLPGLSLHPAPKIAGPRTEGIDLDRTKSRIAGRLNFHLYPSRTGFMDAPQNSGRAAQAKEEKEQADYARFQQEARERRAATPEYLRASSMPNDNTQQILKSRLLPHNYLNDIRLKQNVQVNKDARVQRMMLRPELRYALSAAVKDPQNETIQHHIATHPDYEQYYLGRRKPSGIIPLTTALQIKGGTPPQTHLQKFYQKYPGLSLSGTEPLQAPVPQEALPALPSEPAFLPELEPEEAHLPEVGYDAEVQTPASQGTASHMSLAQEILSTFQAPEPEPEPVPAREAGPILAAPRNMSLAQEILAALQTPEQNPLLPPPSGGGGQGILSFASGITAAPTDISPEDRDLNRHGVYSPAPVKPEQYTQAPAKFELVKPEPALPITYGQTPTGAPTDTPTGAPTDAQTPERAHLNGRWGRTIPMPYENTLHPTSVPAPTRERVLSPGRWKPPTIPTPARAHLNGRWGRTIPMPYAQRVPKPLTRAPAPLTQTPYQPSRRWGPPTIAPAPLHLDLRRHLSHVLRTKKTTTVAGVEVRPFSAEQQHVFDEDARHLIIQGGPGSGKSSTLVAKNADLIASRQVHPERIVTVSSMHSGVEALNEKFNTFLRPLIPQGRGTVHNAQTVHSLAHSILFYNGQQDPQTNEMHYPNLHAIGMGHIQGTLADINEEDIAHYSPEDLAAIKHTGVMNFFSRSLRTALPAGTQFPEGKDLTQLFRQVETFKKDRGLPGSSYEEAMREGQTHLAEGRLSGQSATVAYQQALHKAGLIDFNDYPVLAGQALKNEGMKALPQHLQGTELLNVDEAQDTTPASMNLFEQFAKASGPSTRIIAGLDPMQGLLEDLGSIPSDKVINSYKAMFGRVGGTQAHAELNTNFRSNKSSIALSNAFLDTESLRGYKGKSPHQVPGPGTSVGTPEQYHLANADPLLHQKMFTSMMARTGVEPQTVKENIEAGKHPFEGVDFSKEGMVPPKKIPGIFLTRDRRNFFEHMAGRTLEQSLNITEKQARTATAQLLRHGIPSSRQEGKVLEEAKRQFPIGTVGQFRGLEFSHPHMDVTRTGAWARPDKDKMISYIKNLFTGGSRATSAGHTSFFATNRPFWPDQATTYRRGTMLHESSSIPGKGTVRLGEGEGRKGLLLPTVATAFGRYKGDLVPNSTFEEVMPLRDAQLAQFTPPVAGPAPIPPAPSVVAPEPVPLTPAPVAPTSSGSASPQNTLSLMKFAEKLHKGFTAHSKGRDWSTYVSDLQKDMGTYASSNPAAMDDLQHLQQIQNNPHLYAPAGTQQVPPAIAAPIPMTPVLHTPPLDIVRTSTPRPASLSPIQQTVPLDSVHTSTSQPVSLPPASSHKSFFSFLQKSLPQPKAKPVEINPVVMDYAKKMHSSYLTYGKGRSWNEYVGDSIDYRKQNNPDRRVSGKPNSPRALDILQEIQNKQHIYSPDATPGAGPPITGGSGAVQKQDLTIQLSPQSQVTIAGQNTQVQVPGAKISSSGGPTSSVVQAAPTGSAPTPQMGGTPSASASWMSSLQQPPSGVIRGMVVGGSSATSIPQFPALGGGNSGGVGPPEPPDDKKTATSGGYGGGFNNSASNIGRTMTRIGYEMQFFGKLFDQITTEALSQGAEYRRASLSFAPSTSGNDGTSGFFDFSNQQSGIRQMGQKLPMYSQVQLAEALKDQSSLTGSTAVQPQATSSILAMSALSGVDQQQLMEQSASITGTLGQGKNQAATSQLMGSIYKLYNGNMSAMNVEPTLSATQSILPTLQGINLGGPSQINPLMNLFQTGLNSGMTSQNMPQIASMLGSLSQVGTNPDLSQQQFLQTLFPGQLTADTQLADYQKSQVEMSGQVQQMQLQQTQIPQQIAISNAEIAIQQAGLQLSQQELGVQQQGINLDKAQLTIQQANLNLDKASLNIQGSDLALNQQSQNLNQQSLALSTAQFNQSQYVQTQQYGPIGADVSRTAYFDFMRNQQAAGYNPLSAETGTQFKSAPTFGIENAKFYAGIEHQRQDMVLSRSPLLADAKFQEDQKYLNEQEAFYKQENTLQNESRTFERDNGLKQLAIQGQQLAIQQKHLDNAKLQYAISQQRLGLSQQSLAISQARIKLSEQSLAISQQRLALEQQNVDLAAQRTNLQNQQLLLQQKLLPAQIAAIQNLQGAMGQYAAGQGPVNGQNVQPSDIIRQLSLIVNDAQLKQTIQQSRLPVDQQGTLYQLIKQMQKEGGFDKVSTSKTPADQGLMDKLNKLIGNGGFSDKSNASAQSDAMLFFGGKGATWTEFIGTFKTSNDLQKQIASSLSSMAPSLKTIATALSIIGPALVGLGLLFNGGGFLQGLAGSGIIGKAAKGIGSIASGVATGIPKAISSIGSSFASGGAASTFLESAVGSVAAPLAVAGTELVGGWMSYDPKSYTTKAKQARGIPQMVGESLLTGILPGVKAGSDIHNFVDLATNSKQRDAQFPGLNKTLGNAGQWWNNLWKPASTTPPPSSSQKNTGVGGPGMSPSMISGSHPISSSKATGSSDVTSVMHTLLSQGTITFSKTIPGLFTTMVGTPGGSFFSKTIPGLFTSLIGTPGGSFFNKTISGIFTTMIGTPGGSFFSKTIPNLFTTLIGTPGRSFFSKTISGIFTTMIGTPGGAFFNKTISTLFTTLIGTPGGSFFSKIIPGLFTTMIGTPGGNLFSKTIPNLWNTTVGKPISDFFTKTLPGLMTSTLKSIIPSNPFAGLLSGGGLPAPITHFASGGIALSRTRAEVGEQEPEAIIPLSKLSSLLGKTAGSSTGSGTTSTVTIQHLIGNLHLTVSGGTGGNGQVSLSETAQDELMSQLLDILTEAAKQFVGKLQ